MFIGRLWRGEYSLVKTYWLFYVVGWGIFSLPIRWFSAINENLQVQYVNFGIFALSIFLAYGSIVLVGLWRSACKYEGRKLWAILAKIIFCIGVLIQVLTIFALGKSSPLNGVILFYSAIIPFISSYVFRNLNNKKYALITILCLCLLVPTLLVGINFKASKKVVWMPLINTISFDVVNNKMDKGVTYLDFNSITQRSGRTYAYVASEYFNDDGMLKFSVKQYYEFDCIAPSKLRVLSSVRYQSGIDDGFGNEISRNDDMQSTIAKMTVTNGGTYSGGWRASDAVSRDISSYCQNPTETASHEVLTNQSLCSFAKNDMAILKSVCDSR